jgi:ketosteroid isomerase-like protein
MTKNYTIEPTFPEEIQAICNADKGLIEAEVSRDIEAVMGFIASGVVLHPPGRPPVIGRESVREFYAEWFAIPYTTIDVYEQQAAVAASGDLAYVLGQSALVLSGPQGDLPLPGKYLSIWRKIDDQWLLAAISWTANEPSDSA